MPTRKPRGAPFAGVALSLFLLLASAPIVRAADPDVPSDAAEGWKKVISYARCAFLVFVAASPAGWSAAIFDCARTYVAEASAGGGA